MKPNPGSDDALAQGCTCPVLDNAHGRGAYGGAKNCWWVDACCPLHGGRNLPLPPPLIAHLVDDSPDRSTKEV